MTPSRVDQDVLLTILKDSEETQYIDNQLALAATTWPGIRLGREQFLLSVLRRSTSESDSITSFVGLHLQDLYLCAACKTGDTQALRYFSEVLQLEVGRALAHLDKSGDLKEEVQQTLYCEFFVAPNGKSPKIESYRGRGPLGRWLHVVATRQALMWLRHSKRECELPDLSSVASKDFELEYLKQEYRENFSHSFANAMSLLSSKARNLLYYHTVRGLTIDQMGAIYRVHRTTAFRWLRDARQELVKLTRESLAQSLELKDSEIDSILALIRSNLDISVERLLRGDRQSDKL